MSFDAEHFVLYQIGNAQVRRHPFPHLFVRPVFPEDYFQQLRASLPPLEWLRPIEETGTVTLLNAKQVKTQAYPGRYIADVADIEEREQQAGTGTFWLQLSHWLASDRLRKLLLEKFAPDIQRRFGEDASLTTDIDARLVRDFTHYAIGPHTDSPNKLISLLFYLPKNESLSHLGTSIYAHEDPAFRCEGKRHHSFQGFKKVASMQYVPNALFAFFKTDYSFHGVDRIADPGVERDLLLYNIYVRAVRRERRGSFLWPWRRSRAQWAVYKRD